MQHTGQRDFGRSSAHAGPNARFAWMAVLAVAVALCALALAFPQHAWAKSYTMPRVSIDAQLADDGSLHVVETREFDFDGSFTAVWWTIGALPSKGALSFNGMRMGVVGEDGALEMQDVEEVPFQTEWRAAGGPGRLAYSVDAPQQTCYLFFNVFDATMVAEIDYTVTNAVSPYADCAELYWKYVADEWAEDSENVSCTITLPVPQGVTPKPGSTVRAWGHGPLDGRLEFNNTADQVTYTVGRVKPGEFAEARIVMPPEWFTAIDPSVSALYAGQEHLDAVLEEEAKWAEEANMERNKGRLILGGLGAVALGIIGWVVTMFFRHGKEHKPQFAGDYWRDDPDKGTHPAVVSRLWSFDSKRATDFTATIMHLANQGAVCIKAVSHETEGLFGKDKTTDDYKITLSPQYVPDNDIDKRALDILFGKASRIAKRERGQLWLSDIGWWGKKYPEQFTQAMEGWQDSVSRAVQDRHYFEETGDRMQAASMAVGAGALVVGGVASYMMENFLPLIVMGAAGVVAIVLSLFMPRRSYEGVDVYARCAALRKWLTEFTALDERPPTDVKVWGKFIVYAYIFGVADEVIKELREAVPEVFTTKANVLASDHTIIPWYGAYDIDGISRRASFSVMLDNTIEVVGEAISAAASASGSGGGFSGGGGGGFGGGGGGGAR